MKKDYSPMECDILLALSDFKPHNQNQIVDILGNDHEESTDRSNVSKCLKKSENLKKYLVPALNGFGESGNRRVLRQDIQTLREIAKKYPSIIIQLYKQKNDKILDMIQADHPEFHGLDIEISPEIIRNIFKNNPIIEPFLKAQNQAAKDNFKKYLRESPTFFKMCLLHDSEHLKDKAEGIHFGLLVAIVEDKEKVKKQCDSAGGYVLGHVFYWFCNILDVLEF